MTGRFEFRSDATRAAGVDRALINFAAPVSPQGKMTTWLSLADMTDQQTATFLALSANPQPASITP